ncbi:hypothetical protein L9F63_001305, partial [Diploptera punctata]
LSLFCIILCCVILFTVGDNLNNISGPQRVMFRKQQIRSFSPSNNNLLGAYLLLNCLLLLQTFHSMIISKTPR